MSADEPPPSPSPEAEETFARFLLSRSHGSVRGIEELAAQHPQIAAELRELHARWNRTELGDSQQSLRERLRGKRGLDLDPGITLEEDGEEQMGSGDGSGSSSRVLTRIRKEHSDSSRYTLRGEIARGGMGAILRVWDEDLRRSLAMKVVLGKDDGPEVEDVKLARFLEEAQITGQLDHPGVVPVHEIGIGSDGRAFFTMQLVKGRDLKEIYGLVRAENEGWNLTRALNVILRVCEAMAFAHEKKVIHRDIKPANVMVGRFGETYVMDWGLAKVLGREDTHDVRIRPADQVSLSIVQTDRGDSSRSNDSPLQTMDGDVVGTPCYMAPEQAKGVLEDIGPQSDVYAVGALLYELLSGFPPYMSSGERISPVAVLGMVIQSPPTSIEELDRSVPSELIAICEKAMARDPRDRYGSMMAMAEDLRAFLENRVVTAYETGSLAEFKKWVGRNQGMAAGMAAAGLAVMLGLGGAAAVQTSANEELKETNDALSTTRDQLAESNSELGAANDGLRVATERAQEQEREARTSSYSANLAAARASLSSGGVHETRRRLELCPEDLRGWEWRRLDLELDSSSWSVDLKGEARTVIPFLGAAANANGTQVAIATAWNKILIVDPGNGETVSELELPRAASAVTFSPDDRHLVTSSSDRTIRIWDRETLAELRSIERAHRSVISAVEVSPDGTRLLSIGVDKFVRVWDLQTGDELVEQRLGGGGLCARWSPDGSRFATGAQDRLVRVHDAVTGEVLLRLEGHDFAISSLDYSPSGRFLASGELGVGTFSDGRSQDRARTLRIWDAETGREVREFSGHADGITSLEFLPDGGRIVTTSGDGSVRLFELDSGRARTLHGHSGAALCAAASRGGAALLTAGADWTLRGWELGCATGIDLGQHPRAIYGVAATPSGEVISLSRDGILKLQDARTGQTLHDFREHPPNGTALAYAPGTGRLATLGGTVSGIAQSVRTVMSLWDVGTRALLTTRAFETSASDIDITPDGSVIVVGVDGGKLIAFDGPTGEVRTELEVNGDVLELALHPDGRSVVAATHRLHEGKRTSETIVWELESATSRPFLDYGCRSLRFVAGGELIAVTAGNTASLWRSDDLSQVAVLQGHSDTVEDVALSPDGQRLASVSDDGSVRIWDAEGGELLLSLNDLDGPGEVVTYLDDDRFVVGLEDGRLHVYTAAPSGETRVAHREGQRVLRAAHRALAPLFEELTEPEQVARRLRTDDTLDRAVREAALNVTRRIETTPQQLDEESWRVVKTPFVVRNALDEVVWKSRLGIARDPEDESAHRLLGMALFRLGRDTEALPSLERSDELRVLTRRARPEVAAFLAMTHHRRGNPEEAAAHLERLRGLMSISVLKSNRDSVALMTEAEELLTKR